MTNSQLQTYVRDSQGRWTRKTKWDAVTLGIIACIFLGASIVQAGTPEIGTRNLDEAHGRADSKAQLPCLRVGTQQYDCSTDLAAVKKWKVYLDQEIERLEVRAGEPQAVLRYVCRSNGFTDENCPRILYGMAKTESGMRAGAVGDSGKSLGYFQIHLGYHPSVKRACLEDLECSADWTLKRMIRFGFGQSKTATNIAIMKHNGTPNIPATKAYLAKVLASAATWK